MSTDPTLRLVKPSADPSVAAEIRARTDALRGGILKFLMEHDTPRQPMCCGCEGGCDGECQPTRPAA